MSRPVRICFVTTGLGGGGAETMLFRVVTRLDRRRFNPIVVSLMDDGDYGPDLRRAGVPVTSIGFSDRLPTPTRLSRLVRSIRQFGPDVIMGWMYHGNLAASLGRAWAAPGAALAWNIRHSVYDLANERILTRQLIRLGAPLSHRVDATVYVTGISLMQHVALGYAATSAVVVNNGIDPPASVDRAAVREDLGISPNDVVIGHVARLHPMKDHSNFLRAARLVAEADPAVKVMLVGKGVSASNEALRPLLAAPALAGRVIVLGERRDVPRLLGAMDVFCLSSFSEGFPNVVLEAAAAGLPCVVTAVGAAPEIAGDGGLVVPPRDPRALAGALLQLTRLDARGRTDLGAAARSHAERYSLTSVVARYSSLIEGLSQHQMTDRRLVDGETRVESRDQVATLVDADESPSYSTGADSSSRSADVAS